ncbi:winged helix-turn-helix domain-containing protein [Thermodesulforhabdus norvegica]|uniref:Molybdate transport system regulatory protein n=1 Tax=Thermodesulforhabdus norvegica TaxID=39841 RepID=A0A1I4SEM0_9BACT|nr:LysR family transcriptional regulator [Thermodesulforhabdus norvegica]SFM62733.1 molybdate transport system regulatory protein [Thermodesulforhabdus norvegica]
MGKDRFTMRLHLWLEGDGGVVFGPGRAQLLAKVQECGSLRKAAEELGMSYRAAWGKIKKTEELIGKPLLEQSGTRKDGYSLTAFGRRLLESYTEWFRYVEKVSLEKARELFPWDIKPFE